VQRVLIRVDPPRRFEERIELEDSIEDLEFLALILNRLLNQISTRLARVGLQLMKSDCVFRNPPRSGCAVGFGPATSAGI
jgi:hypothetical protein